MSKLIRKLPTVRVLIPYTTAGGALLGACLCGVASHNNTPRAIDLIFVGTVIGVSWPIWIPLSIATGLGYSIAMICDRNKKD